MDAAINELDTILTRDSALHAVWEQLREKLTEWADPARYPDMQMDLHIDHGPRHWERVRANAARLWRAATVAKSEWWSADSAFLISAGAWLHDVSAIRGQEHIDLTSPPFGAHLRDRFRDAQYGDITKLTNAAARSPLGQFIRRKYQGLIAAKVIDDLSANGGPLESLSEQSRKALAFLVTHYTHIDDAVTQAAEIAPPRGDRLLAIASVLLFSDWAHLDGSRVGKGFLEERSRFATSQGITLLGSPCEEDGGPVCALPKFFRSHYVSPGEIVEGTQDGAQRQLRFSLSVCLPRGLDRNGMAVERLMHEWRSHFLPARLRRLTAGDYLEKYAGIELLFREPGAQWDKDDVLPAPPVVRDFWVASNWLNLSDAAQFCAAPGRRTPAQEVHEAPDFDSVYCEWTVQSSGRPGRTPCISRRIFLYCHYLITRGHQGLATWFFRSLSHNLACLHNVSAGAMGPRPSHLLIIRDVAERLSRLLYRLSLKRSGLDVIASSHGRTIATVLGFLAHPGPVLPADVLRAVTEEVAGIDGTEVETVLSALIANGAIENTPGGVCVVDSAPEGALIALLGAPFWQAASNTFG